MAVAAKSPQSAVYLSIALLVMTLPVYIAVNLEKNLTVVGAYTLGLFLMIIGLTLYCGIAARRSKMLVSIYVYLILLVAFQFSTIGFFSFSTDVQREPVVALFAVKTLLAFGIGLTLLVLGMLRMSVGGERRWWAPYDKAAWLFLLHTLVSFGFSGASIEPKVSYLIHSFGTMAITWLVFRIYRIGEEEFAAFGKIISGLCLFLVVVGILIYNFYEIVWLNYLKVQVAYAGAGNPNIGMDLPPWFETGFGIGSTYSVSLRRFVSLVGNHVTVAYLFSFAYIASLFLGRFILAPLFALATVLTWSKGGILFLFVVTVFYLFPIRRRWAPYVLDVAIVSAAVAVATLVIKFDQAQVVGFKLTLAHQLSNIGFSSLFGFGIGAGGTMAAMAGYVEGPTEITGAETGLGEIVYQLGLLGTVLYAAFFLCYRDYITRRLKENDKKVYRLAQGCATGILINSIFQSNLINLTVYLPYLFFLAAVANQAEDAKCTEAKG